MKRDEKITIRLSSDEESDLHKYLQKNRIKASEFVRFAIRTAIKGNYCTKTELLQIFHRILCALDSAGKEKAKSIVWEEIQKWNL